MDRRRITPLAQKLTSKKKLARLSPQEQDLENLRVARNKIFSAWNFHNLKSWTDYEKILGGPTIKPWQDLASLNFLPLTLDNIKLDLSRQEQAIKERDYANYNAINNSRVGNDGYTTDNAKDSSSIQISKTQSISTLWPSRSSRPLQLCELFALQEEAAQETLDNLYLHNKAAWLCRAGVGTGKTYVVGAVLRAIIDLKLLEKSNPTCIAPWRIVYVTKASIVEQTRRVLRDKFSLDVVNQVVVTNYDSLRATFGDLFINWQTQIVNGLPTLKPIWRDRIHPILFIWDECQALKNSDSLQSLVGQSVNDIDDGEMVKQLFLSATPFTRVIEAKCFSVATRVPYTYGVQRDAPLNNAHWLDFAKHIAAPSDPAEHNEAAVGRLVEYLDSYIGGIKNLRPQFHARNGIKIIDFLNKEEADRYHKAWEDYCKKKAQIEGAIGTSVDAGSGRMAILAQFTIFRREAETIRAEWLAQEMYHRYREGFAPTAALCFKAPIARAITILIEKYGISRDQISVIWGGLDKTRTVKKKKRDTLSEEERQELEDKFNELSATNGDAADLLASIMDMDEEVVEQVNQDVPKHYRLGSQSRQERQNEIDRFQSGKTVFCFFTFKAGGVGLSLHHTDEQTTIKARRKPNGYVVEEDIGSIPTRPRCTILTPTYSAPELVQGLGRCPRLTSMSDTYQYVVFYRGTIEEQVAHTVSNKLRCLKKVVRMRESWEDIILKSGKGEVITETIQALPKDEEVKLITPDNPEEEDDGVFLDEGKEEEEE